MYKLTVIFIIIVRIRIILVLKIRSRNYIETISYELYYMSLH